VARHLVALSPDGKYLAYVANFRLNVRALERLESTPIRGTEGDANGPGAASLPFFSPDSRWIGFWQRGQIKKVDIDGGAIVTIASAANPNSGGLVWEDDGTILFVDGRSILRVSEGGGKPEVIVENLAGRPACLQVLPGKRNILFTLYPDDPAAETEIVVRSLDTGQQQTLLRGGIDGRWVPTGHIVYFAEGSLLAVPFDLRALTLKGSAVPVVENVGNMGIPGRAVSVAHATISPDGTLAYIAGSFRDSGSRTLIWVDRRGGEESLGLPENPYVYPRLSPDGSRIALTLRDQERDLWIWDIRLKTLSRFTFDPAEDRHAVWTRDSNRILFGSNRQSEAAMWWQAADLSGTPERLAGFPIQRYGNLVPTSILPDGSRVIAYATGPAASGQSDLWTVSLTGDPRPEPLLATAATERNAEISPDGRWIAYEALEGSQYQVSLRPFPDVSGGKRQVSTAGGTQPLWARDGKELFFLDPSGALMSVRVGPESPPTLGTPVKILNGLYVWYLPTYAGRFYDVSPDGQRFLMLKATGRPETNAPTSITVVQNWFEELKRLVPTN
jgi:Tol biopolymer transport system component